MWSFIIHNNLGREITDAQPAVDWGKANNLSEATPRQIYAVAHQVPDLNKRVGMRWMELISPQFVTFEGGHRVCNAHFHDAEHHAILYWFGGGWRDSAWFVFSCECALP